MVRLVEVGSIAVVIALTACGSRKGEDPGGEATAKVEPGPAPEAAAPIDAAPVPATIDAMGPTESERAAYKKHLRAGRRFAKADKWGDAVAEFRRAVRARPNDGRALSELGWAAFNAGDYDVARRANAESVTRSTDDKVKAASLYNLGRVEEAAGDRDAAAKHYRASLALRPHDAVRARLESLGREAPVPGVVEIAELPCTAPAERSAICPCLVDAVPGWIEADWADQDLECTTPKSTIAGVRTARLTSLHHDIVFLLGEAGAKWSVVAFVGRAFDPGVFGVMEQLTIEPLESQQVGSRRVVRVTSEHHRRDRDPGVGAEESQSVREVLLCPVPADATKPIACALRVPVSVDYEYRPGELVDEGARAADDTGTLRIALADDGTATVALETGVATPRQKAVLGAHRLW